MMTSRVTAMMLKTTAKTMTLEQLENLIIIHLGSSPITIKAALRTLRAMGFIKDIGNARFEITTS